MLSHRVYYVLYNGQSEMSAFLRFRKFILYEKTFSLPDTHILKPLSSAQSCGWTAHICHIVIGSWLSHDPVTKTLGGSLGRQLLLSCAYEVSQGRMFAQLIKLIKEIHNKTYDCDHSVIKVAVSEHWREPWGKGICLKRQTSVVLWLAPDCHVIRLQHVHNRGRTGSVPCHHCFGLFDDCTEMTTLLKYLETLKVTFKPMTESELLSVREGSFTAAFQGCHVIKSHPAEGLFRCLASFEIHQGPSPSFWEFSRMPVCILCRVLKASTILSAHTWRDLFTETHLHTR